MGVLVDKTLRDLSQEDSERTLDRLMSVIGPHFPGGEADVRAQARLMVSFAETATRLAIDRPEAEGERLIACAKANIRLIWMDLAARAR
jgi:hypothetical protein